MKNIKTYLDIPWLPKNSIMDLVLCEEIDKEKMGKTTSTFAFVFSGDKIVVFKHANEKRGFEIPGGHVENGEKLKEAVEREILEEVGCSVKNVEMLGCQVIRKTIAEDKYPELLSNQAFFTAEIDEWKGQELAEDSKGAAMMSFDVFMKHLKDRGSQYVPLFRAAIDKQTMKRVHEIKMGKIKAPRP